MNGRQTPTRAYVFFTTLPLAAFLACVWGTSYALYRSEGRVKHVALVYGLNSITGVAALISLIKILRLGRLSKTFLCFAFPFLLAIWGLGVVLVVYQESESELTLGEDSLATYLSGLTGIVIASVAWVWLLSLYGFLFCGTLFPLYEAVDNAT